MSKVIKAPPPPGSPEWMRLITPSKIPAILGISPWESQFSLWHKMHGDLPAEQPSNDIFDWGHAAEDSLVNWWKLKNPGWRTNNSEIAYTNSDLPFPNLATLDRRAVRGRRYAIIECKTTRNLDEWGKPGEPHSVPLYYEAQVLGQMAFSNFREAYVVVLGYGVPEIHPVPWDRPTWNLIFDECVAWNESLKAGVPPALDASKATYEAVRGLHPDIERGVEVELPHDLAASYLDAVRAKDSAETALRQKTIEVADFMGTAHKAMCRGVKIADRRARGNNTPTVYPNKRAAL